MQPSFLAKKLIPAFVQRHWRIWLCSLCFVVPFLVAGAGGWLIVQINDDHPGQSLNYEAHVQEVQEEGMRVFIRDGLNAGLIGLGIGVGVGLLITLWKSRVKGKSS
jgi:hypothetical protein